MSTVSEQLEAGLVESVGWASVTPVADGLLTVLVPSTRYSHDHTLVTVELRLNGWRLTDAGEIAATFGDQLVDVMALLRCAGADMALDESTRLVTEDVAHDEDLPSSLIGFAHYVSATPLMWRAYNCDLDEGVEVEESVVEPSIKVLARDTRKELIRQCGGRYSSVLRLNRRMVGAAGIGARVPLSAATGRRSIPRLIAACIDTTAAKQSVTAAEGNASFVLDVARDFTIPKWVVVKGAQSVVDQMAEFYDRDNVGVVSFDDLEALARSLREAVPEYA